MMSSRFSTGRRRERMQRFLMSYAIQFSKFLVALSKCFNLRIFHIAKLIILKGTKTIRNKHIKNKNNKNKSRPEVEKNYPQHEQKMFKRALLSVIKGLNEVYGLFFLSSIVFLIQRISPLLC